MEVITHGEVGLTPLPLSEGVTISVRAPGMHMAWRSVEAVPELEAVGGDDENEWSRAIADNELTPFAAMEAQPLAVGVGAVPSLAMPDSEDAYVEMRATPPPDEGLLVMVESDGVVQWYLPTNAPQTTMAALDAESAGASTELRFMIPQSTLARGSAVSAFGEGIGGAIVRLFRFKI